MKEGWRRDEGGVEERDRSGRGRQVNNGRKTG